MRRWGGALFIVWLALAMQSHGAQRWRWSNPRPHGATIFDLASLGSFVAQAGEFGQLYVSDDLEGWMPRPTGVTNSLRSALFFQGRLVLTGSDGIILTSEGDAMSRFQKISLGTPDWIEAITEGLGRLVAVGDYGAIYTSLDATNWLPRLPPADDWLTSVAYGAGRFVAVGYEGYVITSPDGLIWSGDTRIGTSDLNKVVFMGGQFWILGNNGFVRRSNTGLTWNSLNVQTTNDLFDVATDGREVVLVGRSELRTSAEPFTQWTNRISSAPGAPPAWTYYAAHWDGSEFLVSGRSGIFVEGFRTNATSPLIWRNNSDVPRNWIWSMTSMDGIFAACGDGGGIFTSGNGYQFSQESVPLSARDEILEGIGGNTNLLVAVGTAGVVLYSPGGYTNITFTNGTQVTTQRVSLLGLRWEAATRPTLNELQGVAAFGSLYIISGGQGSIFTSPDGRNWQPRNSGVNKMLSSIAASLTRAIAVGDVGALTISDNGTSWTPSSSGVTNWIYQARYLNGQFVAVGEAGLIMTSPDGIAWTRRTSGTAAWLNAVAYGQGNYYAVGGQGTILKSTNAVNWSIEPALTQKSLYGVASDDFRVVAAGLEGGIVRSRIAPFPAGVDFLDFDQQNGGLAFLFAGELDQAFTLQKTSNFDDWMDGPELEVTDDSGSLIYFDAMGDPAYSFYRTTLLPP